MAKVISIGVHILDVLGRYVSAIPEGQGIALIDEIRITAAGTAAGTSVDLAKLGCEVIAVGAVGNDEMGSILIGILDRYGITTKYMVKKEGVQTSGTMLPIRPNGERPALHVMGANAYLTRSDIPFHLFAKGDFVHVAGFYLMSKFDGDDTVETLRHAKAAGATTTMDILGVKQERMAEKILPCMPFLDFFMPNLEEAQMITGLSDPEQMCSFFLEAGAKHVVLKMGARGSLLIGADGSRVRVPAYKVEVVDTTGCGDAWSAGFIAGLSRNLSLSEAAHLGSACGSLVASGLGSDAGIIDYESTQLFMATTPTLPLLD
ncbi:MAG: sugar kinase [Actinobacteria bacterium]|nr:sugar kinase [Actinomycetota bacterium]